MWGYTRLSRSLVQSPDLWRSRCWCWCSFHHSAGIWWGERWSWLRETLKFLLEVQIKWPLRTCESPYSMKHHIPYAMKTRRLFIPLSPNCLKFYSLLFVSKFFFFLNHGDNSWLSPNRLICLKLMIIKVEINILFTLSRVGKEEFPGRRKGCPKDNL